MNPLTPLLIPFSLRPQSLFSLYFHHRPYTVLQLYNIPEAQLKP